MRTADQTLEDFCSQLAAGTPAPGGGAAAAVAGALGAALVGMTAGLTVGRPKFAAVHDEMVDLQAAAQRMVAAFLHCADEDQAAFGQVMAGYALPKSTPEETAARKQAVQEGYKAATRAPLATMGHSVAVMRAALAGARRGNPNVLSDAYVGYLAASTAFEGALWSVAMNIPRIHDEPFREEVIGEVRRLRDERSEIAEAFRALVPDPVAAWL